MAGSIELWDLSGPRPRRMARLHPALHGLVATLDGYIDGSPEALDAVRFGDGWALYDLTDLPQRHSPERVREALRVTSP